MSFQSLGIAPSLLKALSGQNISKPYPIQEKAIPAILAGKDVLGIAKTGSGKTASYVLPTLMNLGKRQESKNRMVDVWWSFHQPANEGAIWRKCISGHPWKVIRIGGI